MSVYMDGVRLNQPFGDVVSWDLIPRLAISSTTVMPGSNPLFGLNTLGGAIAIQTKTADEPRHDASRRSTEAMCAVPSNWSTAVRKRTGSIGISPEISFARMAGAPTRLRTSVRDSRRSAWHRLKHDAALTLAHADNSLNGNGLQEQGFLDREYASVYTKPDNTNNRSTFLNFTRRHRLNGGLDALRERLLSRHPHRHAQR